MLNRAVTSVEKERVEKFLTLHCEEISRTNYAICRADFRIKNNKQATVLLGNSFIPHNPDRWREAK